MHHLRSTWVLLLVATACGSGFTSAGTTDAATDTPEETSADAETHGPVDSGTESSADVAEGSSDGGTDARPDVGTIEAGPCTPLSFPLPPPGGCTVTTTITGPGAVWLLQSQATPPQCSSYALDEAGTACERCVQSFTCACIDPDASLVGVTCLTGPNGPVLSQN